MCRGFDRIDPSRVTTPTPILFAEPSNPIATSRFFIGLAPTILEGGGSEGVGRDEESEGFILYSSI